MPRAILPRHLRSNNALGWTSPPNPLISPDSRIHPLFRPTKNQRLSLAPEYPLTLPSVPNDPPIHPLRDKGLPNISLGVSPLIGLDRRLQPPGAGAGGAL
jgi:hypothetical protein